MNKKILIILLTGIVICTCESGVETKNDKIDINNFTWEIDTLMFEGAFQISLSSIWGSDNKNVYACGHSSPGIADLWKFNGIEWQIVPQNKYNNDLFARVDLIDGTDHFDVWIGGRYDWASSENKPFISHFNGNNWQVHKLTASTGNVYSLHSISNNQVLVGGEHSQVWFFDGTVWSKNIVQLEYSTGVNCIVRAIKMFNNEVHLLITGIDLNKNSVKYWYVTGNMGNWIVRNYMEIDSQNRNREFGYVGFFQNKNELFSYRPGVYKLLSTNKWERVFSEISDNMAICDVEAIDDEQFLAIGEFEIAKYFDGINLITVESIPKHNFIYWDLEIVDSEIFILGLMNSPPYSTIIIHGKVN